MKVLQLGFYRSVLVALFCGSLFLAVCLLVLGCRRRCLRRRRRRLREQKLRQQTKYQQCNDDRQVNVPDESSKLEMTAVYSAPPATSVHNVCHCLPRGLRRKSPATAVIRRGRSIESLPLDRRTDILAVAVPRLKQSASLAVLSRPVNAGSRPDLVQIPTPDDNDRTSGSERWTPITVAGETTFPVQPSAAIFLSLDVDDVVRVSRRESPKT